mmetsp:Transcript_35681/g.87805  ORF Transcript_35681/g.87805 Transcript_35681/m.87805 type:complete len:305 (-) Transcript_35681:297-1211(-)
MVHEMTSVSPSSFFHRHHNLSRRGTTDMFPILQKISYRKLPHVTVSYRLLTTQHNTTHLTHLQLLLDVVPDELGLLGGVLVLLDHLEVRLAALVRGGELAQHLRRLGHRLLLAQLGLEVLLVEIRELVHPALVGVVRAVAVARRGLPLLLVALLRAQVEAAAEQTRHAGEAVGLVVARLLALSQGLAHRPHAAAERLLAEILAGAAGGVAQVVAVAALVQAVRLGDLHALGPTPVALKLVVGVLCGRLRLARGADCRRSATAAAAAARGCAEGATTHAAAGAARLSPLGADGVRHHHGPCHHRR